MPIPVTVPRLGWSMEEAVFVQWLKQSGEQVRAGDALFLLESEKATQEVESLDEGVLHLVPDGPDPGATVSVGTLIAYLLVPGESPSSAQPRPAEVRENSDQSGEQRGSGSPLFRAVEPSRAAESGEILPLVPPAAAALATRRAISPRARRVARELGVDWSEVAGSGRHGRIRERDILAAAPTPPTGGPTAVRDPRRQTIAARMMASVSSTAPVTLTTRVRVANLVGIRNQFRAASSSDSVLPALHDLIIKLVARALVEHPALNGTDQNQPSPHAGGPTVPGIHVGLAVDTDLGLLVPVVKDADRLSLREIAATSRDAVERARLGKLSAEQMRGGTFTITNLGMHGIDAFTPIINYPQVAILGIGAIRKEAVVLDDDRIAPIEMMTLSLTFDHRHVDGAPAARFLRSLAAAIENPAPYLVS